MRRARCGDTERGERGAEPRNEEKQDGSITRYEALPRNVMEQVRLCIMNKIHMEEKPSIPRQSHGTRRTMCENTEREEQGAETRNEKSKMQSLEMRRNKMAVSLVTRLCLVTEQVRLCLMNKVRKEEKPRIPRQSHGTRRTMCGNTERE